MTGNLHQLHSKKCLPMYLCLFADKTHSEGFSASSIRLIDTVVPTFGINTYNKHTKEKDIIKLLFSSRQLLM